MGRGSQMLSGSGSRASPCLCVGHCSLPCNTQPAPNQRLNHESRNSEAFEQILPISLHSVAELLMWLDAAGDDAISVSPTLLLRRFWLHVRMLGARLASFVSPPLLMDAVGCDNAWSPPRQLCLPSGVDAGGCDDAASFRLPSLPPKLAFVPLAPPLKLRHFRL